MGNILKRLFILVICGFSYGCLEPVDVHNGWFVTGDRVVWGNAQHNSWWGGYRNGDGFWAIEKVSPNITRNAGLSVGPGLTEDLDQLTTNMLLYGYPGFEHNPGLWYDRRRDAHDTECRTDPHVVAPLLEQPWARSGLGTAWDGLSKYDLRRYNGWYFCRLQQFADLCRTKGLVLLFNFYTQHTLLETEAHYVDFPWRPTNCLQATGMPDHVPAANDFYDVSHPVRRELHRDYFRHCLDKLGPYSNIIFCLCHQYTGNAKFVRFWLDTVHRWSMDTGINLKVAVSATRDVTEAILCDANRSELVDVIDLRYWWYRSDGTLYAPVGGNQLPGRYASGIIAAEQSPPEQIYRQVREYKDRFPQKAIISRVEASRQQTFAFLMAGGALLVRLLNFPDHPSDQPWLPPETYIMPSDSAVIKPTYDFINAHLANELLHMAPHDIVTTPSTRVWCLATTDRTYLVYALCGDSFALDLSAANGDFRMKWFDPRTGQLIDQPGTTYVLGGALTFFEPPDNQDWLLWLYRE